MPISKYWVWFEGRLITQKSNPMGIPRDGPWTRKDTACGAVLAANR
jgi:hypothetical protein